MKALKLLKYTDNGDRNPEINEYLRNGWYVKMDDDHFVLLFESKIEKDLVA